MDSDPFAAIEGPRHGDRGSRPTPVPAQFPAGLTVAVSREAGARGGTIGRRAGQKLGWQVYDQELLEYVAQEGPIHQGILDGLSTAALAWVEEQLRRLAGEIDLDRHPPLKSLARAVLALGSQGKVVLVGRGAGFFLPRETTLHVRLVAPLEDRIAYLSQALRLTAEEAAERVRLRDQRRAEFLGSYLHRKPGDPQNHDLILNSSALGEDLCVELIVQAARLKAAQHFAEREP